MAGDSKLIVDSDTAVAAEFAGIFGVPRIRADGTAESAREYRQRIWNEGGPAALCLSGGGIRSATFALGVLQALAARGLLSQFHYLSTVSGGGYIGGWLSRWIRTERAKQDRNAPGAVPTLDAPAIVEAALARSATRPHETPAVDALRDNSDYLTPKLGVASRDTWTAIAIVVRNVLLNWLIFAPGLLLLAMVPNLLASLSAFLADRGALLWLLVLGLCLIATATAYAYVTLPGSSAGGEDALKEGRLPRESKVALLAALPILVHSVLLSIVLGAQASTSDACLELRSLVQREALLGFSAVSPFYPAWWTVVVTLSAAIGAEIRVRSTPPWRLLGNIAVLCLIAFACFELLALGVYLLRQLPASERINFAVAVGPVWVTGTALIGSTLYVGFRWIKFGGEIDREWLARLSALKLIPTVMWLVLGVVCLLVPHALFDLYDEVETWIAGAVAAISGPIAVIGGKSALTKVASVAERKPGGSVPSLNTVVAISAYLFFLAVLLLLARAEYAMAGAIARPDDHSTPTAAMLLCGHFWVLGGAALLLLFASYRVNINRFSLHALYRNRLMRGFLGAAVAGSNRQPDPFTDFDFRDDVRMAALDNKVGGRHRLFHVVNICLNVMGSATGAKQERKAEPFVVTPLHAGSAALRRSPSGAATGAFAMTDVYGGNEPYRKIGDPGIHLSTAIAISGAAANSSMGYNSSPATALLLTMFNVRLGSWLPNPAWPGANAAHLQKSGPRNALRPLLTELLGLTNDQSKYLQLSDGGHFENLGIYEMVRRRCRNILVVDSGCDPKAGFDDLGNAVRQCRLDFGVDIDFSHFPIAARGTGQDTSRAFAVGRLDYHDGSAGTLIYIKPSYQEIPSFIAGMPIDVRQYATAHPEFPHESTADQWFSESQFESYRKLGFELATRMLAYFGPQHTILPALFGAARERP